MIQHRTEVDLQVTTKSLSLAELSSADCVHFTEDLRIAATLREESGSPIP